MVWCVLSVFAILENNSQIFQYILTANLYSRVVSELQTGEDVTEDITAVNHCEIFKKEKRNESYIHIEKVQMRKE